MHQKGIKSASELSLNFVLDFFRVFLAFLHSVSSPWQDIFVPRQAFQSSFINCNFPSKKGIASFKKEYPRKMEGSPLNMPAFLSWKCGFSSLNSKTKPIFIHYAFQKIRFLHSMQCVIDILYCCQKGAMINAHWNIPWMKKNRTEGTCCLQVAICLIFPETRSNILAMKIKFVRTMQYIV